MARTRGAIKRQKIAAVQAAIFNPDVLFQVARYLNSQELCSVKSTCRKMGAKQTTLGGLSLAEEAARRLVESASGEEKACLLFKDDNRWIELYQHLLVRRLELTFDLLAGAMHIEGDGSTVKILEGAGSRGLPGLGSAVCRQNVMRAGRHVVHFSNIDQDSAPFGVGLIRPIQWDESVWGRWFHPGVSFFWEPLLQQKTDDWGDSNVHWVSFSCNVSTMYWSDWEHPPNEEEEFSDFESTSEITLVLDYDKGTLGLLQNGTTLVLKDGLSGEYCWMVTLGILGERISIRRGT